MRLKPIEQATLEWARRIVCGDRGDVQVFNDGTFLVETAAFKLASRDPIDALIVAVARVMQLNLAGVDLAESCNDFATNGVGEEFANVIKDHLLGLSAVDWAALRARADWYETLEQPSTTDEGGT